MTFLWYTLNNDETAAAGLFDQDKEKSEIDSKWSELRKKDKIADSSPASAANRRRRIFHIDYVNHVSIKLSCWCRGYYVLKFDVSVVHIEKSWNFEKWQNFFKFFGPFNWKKKKILQIDSKWSETRKKHKTADSSAGGRRRPPTPPTTVFTSRVC